MLKRLTAGLLAAILLLSLTACGGGGESKGAPAMGRYIEESRALPEGIKMVLAFRADGAGGLDLAGYAYKEPEDEWPSIVLYHSADGGLTWEERDSTAVNSEAMDKYMVEAANWDSQGRLHLFAYDTEDEGENGDYAALFLRMEAEGSVTKIPFDASVSSSGPRSFEVADNGDFLVDCWWQLFHVDGETGAVKYQWEDGENGLEGYDVQGNSAVFCGVDKLVYYDMETGKETGTVSSAAVISSANSNSQWNRLAAFTADGAVCYVDAKGIYQVQPGNSVLEQVVDGTLTSLSTPTFAIQFFGVVDDSFYVVSWTDETWALTAFVYDPETPTLPDRELRIWSMEEDPIIRQAIGVFQKEHKDVYISYELAYTGENAAYSWDEALKTLAAELLAGKGPDILVMDGAPWESYADKGVLLDLSADLEAWGDQLLPAVAGACRREDGTVPAIPAQFSATVLHGTQAAIDASKDLKSMADYLEANRDSFNHPLSLAKLDWLLQMFIEADRDRLYAGDRAAWTEFLTQMGRVWAMEQNKKVEDGLAGDPTFRFGTLYWGVDAAGIDVGYLCKFEDLYAAQQTNVNRGDGVIEPLFGMGLFTPRSILGVNAQSKESELARAFVKTVLSEEVQGAAVGTGIPVNAASLDASTAVDEDPARNGHFATYGTTISDKDGADVPLLLTIDYPSAEYRQMWLDQLKALDKPVFLDGSIQTMIEEETADFFAGKAGLEETVDRLVQKLALYRAEQAG